MPRTIERLYQDPTEIIWRNGARKCGIEIQRSAQVFASWDGEMTLSIGTAETLDPDDSLGQMVLHELCHALVAGPERRSSVDWGLDYDCPEHQKFEHATLRLQAKLADEVKMRGFFASTTDYREYFDRLPENDPLRGQLVGGQAEYVDPAIELAERGLQFANEIEWLEPIREALELTRAIHQLIEPLVAKDSLWAAE